jgi:hypothetical protein
MANTATLFARRLQHSRLVADVPEEVAQILSQRCGIETRSRVLGAGIR